MDVTKITNLKGDFAAAQISDRFENRHVMNISPAKGVIHQMSIGFSGLIISKGNVRVLIPTTELDKLAVAAAPQLNAAVASLAAKPPAK